MTALQLSAYITGAVIASPVLHFLAGEIIGADARCRVTGGAEIQASCSFYQFSYTASWLAGLALGIFCFHALKRSAQSLPSLPQKRKALYYFLLCLLFMALPFLHLASQGRISTG